MNKSCALVSIIALTVIGLAGPVLAMDADELIAKNTEALGGREALDAVKTARMSGKFMTQGMEFPFIMTQMRPNLLRVDVEAMGMAIVQGFDGEKGWSINPMTGSSDPQPMGEVENKSFRLQADMSGPLLDYASKGYTVEYLGEEDVEGTPCYKLRLDTGQDIVLDLFFDKEYYLIIKQANSMMVDENKVETQTYPSDYQEVDGLVIPMAIETRMGDMVANQIKLDTVEHNIEVDPAIFVMPEKEAPAEAPAEGK